MPNPEVRALQTAFCVAISRATSEYSKARITRDVLLSTMPRRGLIELARSQGKSLAEMYDQRQQARARLRAANHKLTLAAEAVPVQPVSRTDEPVPRV